MSSPLRPETDTIQSDCWLRAWFGFIVVRCREEKAVPCKSLCGGGVSHVAQRPISSALRYVVGATAY